MAISENIKKRRAELNMRQEDLAEKVFVDRSMIAKIETGIKQPTLALAKSIADVFGCTVDELIR